MENPPKDVALLVALAGSIAGPEHFAGALALEGAFDDPAVADHIHELHQRLTDDRLELQTMARQKMAALHEGQDKETGESVDVSGDFLYAVIDLRQEIHARAEIKWKNPGPPYVSNTRNAELTLKRGICFHHTAVAGGFGVHSSRMALYEDTPLDAGWYTAPNKAITREEYQHAMALGHRYWGDKPGEYNSGVPYHSVSGANSVLYLNLPFDWYTYHGNTANRNFLGFAWDAKSGADTFERDDMLADITQVYEIGRREGHFADGCELTGHCCYTNKPTDPGAEFVDFLATDVVKRIPGATIDLDFKASPQYLSMREVLAA